MKLKYVERIHAYYLDGVRAKGVTGFAGIPDDKYNMHQAEKRKIAIGLATTPKLVEGVAAHIDERDALDAYIEEAKEKGGAHEGRDRGITAHKIAERYVKGLTIVDTPLSQEIVTAFAGLIGEHQIRVIPDFVERIVVYPEHRLCGRLDFIVEHEGRLRVLDVKGGKWAVLFPHAPTIQIALYANAPLLAGELSRGREGETDHFVEMPDELDRERGLIAHIPEDGPPQLVKVKIDAGWEAAKALCFPTIKWRERSDLIEPIVATATSVDPDEELRSRVAALTDEQRAELKSRWPKGISLKRSLLPHERDVVSILLAEFDKPYSLEQVKEPPDEGRDADRSAVEALRARVMQLDPSAQEWIRQHTAAAHAAGAGVSLRERPSLRRFEIGRALYLLAQSGQEDRLPESIAAVIGDVPGTPGALLASMGVEEATKFAHLVDVIVSRGNEGDETPRLMPVA